MKPSVIERSWHTSDSQGQILAMAFRSKFLKLFKIFPRSLGNDSPFGHFIAAVKSPLDVQLVRKKH